MKAVVTFDCVDQGYVLYHAARTSMKLATQRWGWRFLVITKPLYDCHVWYQKFLLPRILSQYERLLVLDGDMVIRPDCPCPDQYVVNNRTAYVNLIQPQRGGFKLHEMRREQMERIDKIWDDIHILYHDWPMMNGGFQLYTPSKVQDAYEKGFKFALSQQFNGSPWNGDQGIISYMMMCGVVKHVQWLPEDFNFICHDARPMTHWIMHAHAPGWPQKVRQMQAWYEEYYEKDDNL
jgi:hypothetical protein